MLALPWIAGLLLQEMYKKWELKNPNKPLPITSLSSEDKTLFAIVLISHVFSPLVSNFRGEAPTYITQFEKLTVRGGSYNDPMRGTRYKISLLLPNPDSGGLIDVAGVSNMPYKPR